MVVAPKTAENEAALDTGRHTFEVHLSDPRTIRLSTLGNLRRAIGVRRLGETITVPSIDERARRLCHQASSFDLQWSETLVLANALAEFRRPMLATEHDVLWTTIVRADGLLGLLSPRASLSRLFVRRAEIAALNKCDSVVVFKEADASTLSSGGYTGRTLVASPTLQSPSGHQLPQEPPNILFVAAFDRRENFEGSRWFITEVLPWLRSSGVEFRVTFAGAGMAPDLRALATENGIELTGFLPDLDPVYRRSTLAIAPMHRVGGLRFKVPQAMKYGLPVVATTAALRGLEEAPPGSILPPCDRPNEFADAILMLLGNDQRRTEIGNAAKAWINSRFSSEHTFAEIDHWIETAAAASDEEI